MLFKIANAQANFFQDLGYFSEAVKPSIWNVSIRNLTSHCSKFAWLHAKQYNVKLSKRAVKAVVKKKHVYREIIHKDS